MEETECGALEKVLRKRDDDKDMYYIGIGASAGGLEALEALFKDMPSDSGMAFIVIQHLSPDYKSLMNELLARRTSMPVLVAANDMEVMPNTVYLNSPGNDITLVNGRFVLNAHKSQKALNLPINMFFRSLAADQGKRAIAIVLSGTGSDGMLGVRAIKEAGGMIMAQDERTAKFDGMPRSSISTGLVDFVLPPQQMGVELMHYIKHPYIKDHSLASEFEEDRQKAGTFTRILLLLRTYCGVDFTNYKENTIIRRLERRVSVNRLSSLEEYHVLLRESDKEKDTLYRELLIGVTNFFRDKDAFAILQNKVVPNLRYEKKTLRVWCTACSTGEETYSVAMLIQDYIDTHEIDCDVKIFATDIEQESLDFAGRGIYAESVVSDIAPDLLEKYFIRKDNAYQIKESIRNLVVFASHNILKDPPFSKLDLLVCRNLFIYLKSEVQQKLLAMFYFTLSPQGYLFMGSSESIGEMSEAFRVLDSKWKIYQCKEGYQRNASPGFFTMQERSILGNERSAIFGSRAAKKVCVEKVMEQAASVVLPPSLLLDSESNIIHVVNDVNDFLKVKPGQFSTSVFANISNDLSLFVSSILRRLKSKKSAVICEHITGLEEFENQRVTVKGYDLNCQGRTFYLLCFYSERQKEESGAGCIIDSKEMVNTRIAELELELQTGKENLQATVEELETSNEELQSSNEELIASNEELQSTNEELQSVNEELYTVNSEYQTKIEELSCMTEDLDNLLINAEIGALYLDCKFCIRKITPIMSKVTHIMQTDVGRPIFHISFMDNYPDLLSDLKDVLETLKPVEKELVDTDNHVWLARIRPYRTNSYAVDGVLLTLVDISSSKQVELEFENMVMKYDKQEISLARRERLMRVMFDATQTMKLFADESQKLQYVNQAAKLFFFDGEADDADNQEIYPDMPLGLREIFVRAKNSRQVQADIRVELTDAGGNKLPAVIMADPSVDGAGKFCGVIFIIRIER